MRAKWYVGIRRQPFLSTSLVKENTREAFSFKEQEEEDDWWEETGELSEQLDSKVGHLYAFIIGPFATKKGADWFAAHKDCLGVDEAESFAKMKRRNAS